MTIELALARLRKRIAQQREAIGALSTTIDEDRPRRDDVALVGHLADAVLKTARWAILSLKGIKTSCYGDSGSEMRWRAMPGTGTRNAITSTAGQTLRITAVPAKVQTQPSSTRTAPRWKGDWRGPL